MISSISDVRLVLHKPKSVKINSKYGEVEDIKYEEIDFNSFINGEIYEVPYAVFGYELLGKRFFVYSFSFDEKTGVFFSMSPKEVVFKKSENILGKEVVTLESVEGFRVFSGACWSTTGVLKVYGEDRGLQAVEDYNKQVKVMLSVREEYINKLRDKELKRIEKLLV